MKHRLPYALPAALAAALFLPACGDKASSDGGDSEAASVDAAFAEEPIPSQDVADAAAEAAIDESNADEAFEALKAEIEEDG